MSAYVPWRRVCEATTEECTCGGMGPDDPGVCSACRIYHRLKAHALALIDGEADQPATEEDLAT